MRHRAADALTRVVLSQLDRVVAADDPLVGPVERVRALLVADPVAVRVPERALLEHAALPACASQTLREHEPASAGADDEQVDGLRRWRARARAASGSRRL